MDPSGVQQDTIAAIATPAGRGGVGIVRVSGRHTREIGKTVIGNLPQPRQAQLATFTEANGEAIDQGIALFFAGPHSFTGEDVLELQGHGGPVVMDMLLNRIIACGARLAQPGEFSQRAFLNDKIDLLKRLQISSTVLAGVPQKVPLSPCKGASPNVFMHLMSKLFDCACMLRPPSTFLRKR
jgi:tRNA modification GTPase